MANPKKIFFRYRAFSTTTLDSLCHDTIHFAHPGSFNDPLDCSPTLECDSQIEELRKLLAHLVQKRVTAEVLSSLKTARIRSDNAEVHAQKRAQSEAFRELENISYHATNPDYQMEIAEAESWLLVQEIERELYRHYEHGVCCFSTSYSSPLLWSHYGDQHKGICIGYSLERNPVPQLKKVVYGGSRTIKSSALVSAFLLMNEQAQESLSRDVLLRKAKGWSYEHEWRLIGEQGIQNSPLLLKEVTFGLRCSSSVRHSIVKALVGRENIINFFEMYEVHGSYKLRRRALDISELDSHLPKTAKSADELFG